MAEEPASVEIRVGVPAEVLAAQEFDPELDLFRRPLLQRAALADIASEADSCVSVALATGEDGRLVGYAAFHAQTERAEPSEDGAARVLELGALEVAPTYRRRGIASGLLRASFAGGRFDDAVVFARLYAWHYDLGRTGLGPLAYRRFLKRLYGASGLEVVTSSHGGDGAAGAQGASGAHGASGAPGAHGADLIMARRGPAASEASVAAFQRLLGVRLPAP